MPSFNQLNDFYLAQGTSQLLNSWTDPVYKFDSSSFYNWEQDNLPIYDLEDRTNLNNEMAGYPASAVDGMMLTVSATGVDNKKVFSTIENALAAVPNTIRFPIIIEVCTSGQLGGMHLDNKQFEGSGAGLEIINRGFAKILCGSGTQGTPALGPSSLPVQSESGSGVDGSSIIMFSSTSLSAAMLESSSIGVSTTVWDGLANARDYWNHFSRAFVLYPEWGNANAAENGRTIGTSVNFTDDSATTPIFLRPSIQIQEDNLFQVTPYQDNSASSDIVITNPANSSVEMRPNMTMAPMFGASLKLSRATGLVYSNCLSGVSVKGCHGQIFIRGFCVDGGSQGSMITGSPTQRTSVGFDIQNSEVLLENCAATRCKDAGVEIHNSDVTLNRGFLAHHNYELESSPNTLDKKVLSNPTAGLRAINSNITLSAAAQVDWGLPLDSPYCFTRNIVGIDLRNSNLLTDPEYVYGKDVLGNTRTSTYGSQSLALQTFLNLEEGILAKESLISTGQRISSFQNKIGISLDNSICETAEVTVDHNQDVGVKATNSTFNYNKNAAVSWTGGPWYPTTNFLANGQHIVLNSSKFIPTDVDDMPSKYTRFALSGNYGVGSLTDDATTTIQTLPAVVVDNGSYMKAVGTKSINNMATVTDTANAYKGERSIKGSAFRVINSSRLDLYGLGTDATWVIGPRAWGQQQSNAGVYAGDGSHVLIAGPTTICQLGIDALAENNSTIEIGPHQKNGVIDASGYALSAASPSNQTQVNLHATRSCLVANKNSILNMHDLGDYHKGWDNKYFLAGELADYDTGTTGLNTSSFCAAGYLQFYPNPFINYDTYVGLKNQAAYPTGGININKITGTGVANPTVRRLSEAPFPIVDRTSNSVSDAGFGGMCVRAVNDSQVNVKNVTFPTGWENTSGAYYDVSSGNCELLRIWNIADNSQLHASYLSVGNATWTGGPKHPQDASGYYYGPSALWTSDTGTGLSGAPSSTADTSGASVLDSYGDGVDTKGTLGYYGKTSPENIGPFRIYVGVDPKANYLGYPVAGGMTYMPPVPKANAYESMGFTFNANATLITGPPRQLYAQGYATSGDVSAINNQGPNWTNASSMYPDLGASGYILDLPLDQQVENVASSFYYTADMIPADTAANIWLDESAINTFANAKNGLLGSSGRQKIFSYYSTTKNYGGEAFATPDAGFGLGLGSVNLFDIDRDL